MTLLRLELKNGSVMIRSNLCGNIIKKNKESEKVFKVYLEDENKIVKTVFMIGQDGSPFLHDFIRSSLVVRRMSHLIDFGETKHIYVCY